MNNLSEVRQFMSGICDVILEHMDKVNELRYRVTVKEDGSLVTEADIMLEEIIFNHVKNKLDKVVFVGEESFDFNYEVSDHYTLVLDPVDGTENFCTGLKEWGTAFSLWKGKEHLGSCLFMPELGERLMTGDQLERIPFASRLTTVTCTINEQLLDILQQKGNYRMTGCSVYNLYYVIKGSFANLKYPRGAYVWDILPGMLLALEHGCTVLADGEVYDGRFLDPAKKYRIEIHR